MRTLDRIVRASGATLVVTLQDAPKAQGQLLADLRSQSDAIRAAARRRRIRNVRVFGSAARGEESAESDVDLLVDFNASRRGVLPLVGFASDVRTIVGREVDATTVELLRDDILEAIAKARIADDRMRQAEVQGDDAGVQVAFEAILHNLFVIGEAVKAIPGDILEQDPTTPWSEIAALRDVIGHHYHRIVPAIIHRTVATDLGPLEGSVRRIKALR